MLNFITKTKSFVLDTLFILVIFLLLQSVTVCTVDGLSMYPTLDEGDVLLVFKTKHVERGDVVILDVGEETFFVKRVIAKSGETVEVVDTKVVVNGNAIDESYAYYDDSDNGLTSIVCDVPDDSLFVMGDNRKQSYDSRKMGPFSNSQIVGVSLFNLTALIGLNNKQFKLACTILMCVCILMLLSSHNKDRKRLKRQKQKVRHIDGSEVVGDAHVSFEREYDRPSEGVCDSGGEAEL